MMPLKLKVLYIIRHPLENRITLTGVQDARREGDDPRGALLLAEPHGLRPHRRHARRPRGE